MAVASAADVARRWGRPSVSGSTPGRSREAPGRLPADGSCGSATGAAANSEVACAATSPRPATRSVGASAACATPPWRDPTDTRPADDDSPGAAETSPRPVTAPPTGATPPWPGSAGAATLWPGSAGARRADEGAPGPAAPTRPPSPRSVGASSPGAAAGAATTGAEGGGPGRAGPACVASTGAGLTGADPARRTSAEPGPAAELEDVAPRDGVSAEAGPGRPSCTSCAGEPAGGAPTGAGRPGSTSGIAGPGAAPARAAGWRRRTRGGRLRAWWRQGAGRPVARVAVGERGFGRGGAVTGRGRARRGHVRRRGAERVPSGVRDVPDRVVVHPADPRPVGRRGAGNVARGRAGRRCPGVARRPGAGRICERGRPKGVRGVGGEGVGQRVFAVVDGVLGDAAGVGQRFLGKGSGERVAVGGLGPFGRAGAGLVAPRPPPGHGACLGAQGRIALDLREPGRAVAPPRPLRGHLRLPRGAREEVGLLPAGVEPLVPALPGTRLRGLGVEVRRMQHDARAGDDARAQVVHVGGVGSHRTAVDAEHDRLGRAGQEAVGPDGGVRAGELEPARRVDPGVDRADEVDRELLPRRPRRCRTAVRAPAPPVRSSTWRACGRACAPARAPRRTRTRRAVRAAVPDRRSAPRRRCRESGPRSPRPLPPPPVARQSPRRDP